MTHTLAFGLQKLTLDRSGSEAIRSGVDDSTLLIVLSPCSCDGEEELQPRRSVSNADGGTSTLDAGTEIVCRFCADAAPDVQRVEPGSCASNADCPEGEFCDATTLFGCPSAEWRGRCEPIPRQCIEGSAPGYFCGCDGQLYTTGCAANQAEVSLGTVDLCDTPELFACGSELCVDESICVSGMIGDVFDPESCRARPDSCARLTGSELCDCLRGELGSTCKCESVVDSDGTAGTMLQCDSGSGP